MRSLDVAKTLTKSMDRERHEAESYAEIFL